MARGILFAIALALSASLAAVPVRADELERVTVLEENDSLYFHGDRHYTQGFRMAYTSADLGTGSFCFDLFAGPAKTEACRFAVIFGQSIFTPENTHLDPPDPADRPYAGWLYGGAGLLHETDGKSLENAEILLGVVGPSALGEEIQNDYHQLIGASDAEGWDSQLKNEPGIMLTYERFWRVAPGGKGSLFDVVPAAGATVGNVMTYGQAGALLRFGNALGADYGPARVRPALSGTDYFDGDALPGGFGYYLYAGGQARVVGLNIFLDGNSFRQSQSVNKNTLIADLQAGFALFWAGTVKLDFGVVRRSEEFDGQDGADVIGTAAASLIW